MWDELPDSDLHVVVYQIDRDIQYKRVGLDFGSELLHCGLNCNNIHDIWDNYYI